MINDPGMATDFRSTPEGAEVFTTNRDKIGEVKEVRQGSFKVNAAMQPDYWLPIHTVASSTGNRVTLSFLKDRLEDYKSDEPLAA
jgi:hypothetical protein